MITAFRLFSPRRDPWDATGALLRGGRWNSRGTAILYTASSLSLACLEILVHIRNANNLPVFSYSQLAIPDDQIELWNDQGWSRERREAVFESEVLSREEGDVWIRKRRQGDRKHKNYGSLRPFPARQVPSAVVPQEWNYLVDPEDEALKAGWSAPKPFRVDPRLLDPSLR